MATITVEDGTIVTGANSYVSEADFSTYATDRGITISGTAAVLLIQAMDYLEAQPFKGLKYSEDQPLQWPRYGVVIDSYELASDAIPQSLIDVQCELAIGIDGGNNPLANESRATKKEKVGDIEVEYMDGARNSTYLVAANTKIQKLLRSGAGGINAVAIRG